jgi:hypothetical protein
MINMTTEAARAQVNVSFRDFAYASITEYEQEESVFIPLGLIGICRKYTSNRLLPRLTLASVRQRQTTNRLHRTPCHPDDILLVYTMDEFLKVGHQCILKDKTADSNSQDDTKISPKTDCGCSPQPDLPALTQREHSSWCLGRRTPDLEALL